MAYQGKEEEPSKTCSKCLLSLPLTQFYRSAKMSQGRVSMCKPCFRTYDRQRKRTQAYILRERERRERPETKMRYMLYQRKYRAVSSEQTRIKIRAREIVAHACKMGRLVRMPCMKCGATKSEAHHTDYTKPLEVLWLCFPCHRDEHGQHERMSEAS